MQLACMEALAEHDRLRRFALAWSDACFRALLGRQDSATAFVEMILKCFEQNGGFISNGRSPLKKGREGDGSACATGGPDQRMAYSSP